MADTYKVLVVLDDGREIDKGEVFISPRSNRWTWFKAGRGTETRPRSTWRGPQDVREFIARLCRTDVTNVKLV